MYIIQQFIQAVILLIILMSAALFTAYNPYLLIMLAGVLMIIFAIRSIDETESRLLLFMQLIFSVLYVLISDNVSSYLIFYELKKTGKKPVNIIFPTAIFALSRIFIRDKMMAEIILHMIVLACISCIIYMLQKLVFNYLSAKTTVAQAVSVTAVNEMYEKKLNHELTIKNYLADRNARLEERENISRNIHNSVGHSITAAIMTLEAADMLIEKAPDRAREKMNTANERIRQSLSSIRHAVRVLDNDKEPVPMEDFISELCVITDNFTTDTSIKIRTDFEQADKEIKLSQEYSEFLTGAVSEFLTNGVRHGRADVFILIVTADSRHLKISVNDNGKSDFSSQNKKILIESGFGLKRIISFAEKCGGEAFFSNENGFRAVVTLPVMEDNAE